MGVVGVLGMLVHITNPLPIIVPEAFVPGMPLFLLLKGHPHRRSRSSQAPTRTQRLQTQTRSAERTADPSAPGQGHVGGVAGERRGQAELCQCCGPSLQDTRVKPRFAVYLICVRDPVRVEKARRRAGRSTLIPGG